MNVTTRPYVSARPWAPLRDKPRKSGAGNVFGPSDTTIDTVSPGWSRPVAGRLADDVAALDLGRELGLRIVHDEAQVLERLPRVLRRDAPTTFGTGTGARALADDDVDRAVARRLPVDQARSMIRRTMSSAWSLNSWFAAARGVRCARSRSVRASSIVLPSRSGTATGFGPSEGTSVTVSPCSSDVPAAGSTLATPSAGISSR